jgi:hypothetical protein
MYIFGGVNYRLVMLDGRHGRREANLINLKKLPYMTFSWTTTYFIVFVLFLYYSEKNVGWLLALLSPEITKEASRSVTQN